MSLTIRQFTNKGVYCFLLGVTMRHGVAFYPKCHLCGDPQCSLAYLKCLCNGRYILDGGDVCRASFRWTAQALEELLQASDISRLRSGRNSLPPYPALKDLPEGHVCMTDRPPTLERNILAAWRQRKGSDLLPSFTLPPRANCTRNQPGVATVMGEVRAQGLPVYYTHSPRR